MQSINQINQYIVSVDGMHVYPNGINLSKHAPIVMTISDGLDLLIDKTVHRAPISVQKVAWHKVNDAHLANTRNALMIK